MKPVYLLDTNVISEFTKPFSNKNLIKKVSETLDFCAICSTVWQETVEGFSRLPEGKRKRELERYIAKVKETYKILPYDSFASQICGELRARCEKAGKNVPYSDSQIAATAIANNMILVTHNTEDFLPLVQNSILHVEDWWEEE